MLMAAGEHLVNSFYMHRANLVIFERHWLHFERVFAMFYNFICGGKYLAERLSDRFFGLRFQRKKEREREREISLHGLRHNLT